jgi:hypothetical protein
VAKHNCEHGWDRRNRQIHDGSSNERSHATRVHYGDPYLHWKSIQSTREFIQARDAIICVTFGQDRNLVPDTTRIIPSCLHIIQVVNWNLLLHSNNYRSDSLTFLGPVRELFWLKEHSTCRVAGTARRDLFLGNLGVFFFSPFCRQTVALLTSPCTVPDLSLQVAGAKLEPKHGRCQGDS